jgi:hypothetical protein
MSDTARFCSQCGTPSTAQQRFCGRCGTPLAASVAGGGGATAATAGPPPAADAGVGADPPVGDPPPQMTAPDADPAWGTGPSTADPMWGADAPPSGLQWTPPALRLPALNIDLLLAGDWAGGALAAAAGYASALLATLLLVLLAGAEKLPVHATVATVGALVGAAFGGDLVGSAGGSSGGVSGSIGAYPLTITVVAVGVLSLVFWRRLRSRRPGLGEALLQAVRTAVVFAVLLAISSLVFRYRGTLPGEDSRSSVHAAMFSSAVGGFLIVVVVILCLCLRKPEWLPPRLKASRDALAAPIAGVGIIVIAACVLTLLGGVVLIVSQEHVALRAEFAGLLLALPNLAIWGLLVGTGTALVGHGGASSPLFNETGLGRSASAHITDAAEASPWWWLVTIGAIGSILLGALAVVYFSRNLERARRTLLVFAGAYIVAAPLLAHLSSVYVHGDLNVSDSGVSGSGDASLGPSTGGALLLAILVGFAAAILALAVAPKLFNRPVPGLPAGFPMAAGYGQPPYGQAPTGSPGPPGPGGSSVVRHPKPSPPTTPPAPYQRPLDPPGGEPR